MRADPQVSEPIGFSIRPDLGNVEQPVESLSFFPPTTPRRRSPRRSRMFRPVPSMSIYLSMMAAPTALWRLPGGSGLTVIVHPQNRGYGGNQKTCYRHALERGADIVVMIHPDYQYDSRVVPHAVGLIDLDICDIVIGNRIRSRQRRWPAECLGTSISPTVS